MKHLFLFTAFTLVLHMGLHAQTIKVPQDLSSIQAAIDMAQQGDTVLVDTGVYYENIVYRGKDIVVTSYYVLREDFDVIFETIIDGSQAESDTTNVVSIINGETSAATLEGFTLTGGLPGVTVDLDGVYPEGGGLLVRYASPEIKFNYFTLNGSRTLAGYHGAGGMSTSYSNSRIHNNIFYKNYAGAGGAFINNNSSVEFYNNLVVANESTTLWGGIVLSYTDPNNPTDTSYLYNNTIVGNINITNNNIGVFQSSGNKVVIARNNIVYGNANRNNNQRIGIRLNGIMDADYNTFPEGNFEAGNISEYPAFISGSFIPEAGSPCIDAGDPSIEFRDKENPVVADKALFPSQGSLRNDQGYFGGPFATSFSITHGSALFSFNSSLTFRDSIGNNTVANLKLFNTGAEVLYIDSIRNTQTTFSTDEGPDSIIALSDATIMVQWEVQDEDQTDTLFIYHSSNQDENPMKIRLTGHPLLVNSVGTESRPVKVNLYPNPASSILYVQTNLPDSFLLKVIDNRGSLLQVIPSQDSNPIEIDTSQLPEGIYFLKIESDRGSTVEKISISH